MTTLQIRPAPPHGRHGRPVSPSGTYLPALAVAGLGLELVLVLGFLAPLSLWDNPRIVADYRPLATVLGIDHAGAVRFVEIVACAFGAFAVAALVARLVLGRVGARLVLAGTLLFSVTLIPINPLGAQDVYHNIADARTLWVYGSNPAATPPSAHADDPFFPNVPVWEDYPSSYGPLWYALSAAPLPFTGAALWPNVLGQKALTALFLLGTTALAMAIAGRIRPGAAVTAGVLVGWNPLLQFETAGNAHNDVVMVGFALAALYAVTRRWWPAVFPLLALAVAVKYVVILLGPVLLVWLLRRHDVPRRQIALSLVQGAAVGLLLYGPFLAGGKVLDSFSQEADHILASTGAAVASLLMEYRHMDPAEATRTMKQIALPVFLAGYAVLLWRIPRDPSVAALARTCAWVMFLFLVIAKWWFWPWYLLWLVPLAALTPRHRVALVASVFSFTAMLMYLAYFWQLYDDWHHTQRTTAATIFIVPALLAVIAPLVSGLAHRTRAALRPAAVRG